MRMKKFFYFEIVADSKDYYGDIWLYLPQPFPVRTLQKAIIFFSTKKSSWHNTSDYRYFSYFITLTLFQCLNIVSETFVICVESCNYHQILDREPEGTP